mgnify:CR=1 FL=1
MRKKNEANVTAKILRLHVLRNSTITGVAMCETIDNSNSTCRMTNTRLITVQDKRITLVATMMTDHGSHGSKVLGHGE